MRSEVYRWVQKIVEQEKPRDPVLEVGSRDVNGSIRALFPPLGYIGLDARDGPGVDLVMDILTAGHELDGRFNTVVCCETLEHVKEPWMAIDIMARALRPGGILIATWCFVFPLHDADIDKAQCGDYWRTTPQGFEYLLQRASLRDIHVETEGCMRPSNRPHNEQDWQWPCGVFATARRAG